MAGMIRSAFYLVFAVVLAGIIVGLFALDHLLGLSDTETGVIVIVLAIGAAVEFVCNNAGANAIEVQNAVFSLKR